MLTCIKEMWQDPESSLHELKAPELAQGIIQVGCFDGVVLYHLGWHIA